PRQHLYTLFTEFLTSNDKNQVMVHAYTVETLALNEVVSFWGSLAHNGSITSPLEVYATSFERFDWVDLNDEDYFTKVPSCQRPMIIAQGCVEGPTTKDQFTLTGSVYG
ncbi:hypothetical protein BCR39DRAFT_457520, partial [Naematelia encephala]